LKGAVLIFGLLAGVLGAGAIAMGNLASELNLALSLGDDVLAKSILYGILVVGLVGTGLILAWPKLGGAIMVLCAAGWVAAGLVAGHGSLLFAALPITFAGAGGIVAMFGRRRLDPDDDIEDDDEPPRDARRRLHDGDFDEDRGAPPARTRGPAGRGTGIRSEPDFDVEPPPRSVPARYRDEREEYAEETSGDYGDSDNEDYIDADPALDDEGLESPGPGDYPVDDEEDDSEPPYRDEPRDPRQRKERWSLPDPYERPQRRPAPRQEYVPERQPPAPARRQPLPPRNDMRAAPRQRDDDNGYYRAADYPAPRREPPRSRGTYREIAYEDAYERDEPRRGSARSLVRILILLIFILIVLGAAAAVYFANPNLPSVLFGTGRPVAEAISPAPAAASLAPQASPQSALPSASTQPTVAALSPEPAPANTLTPGTPVPLANGTRSDTASTPDMSNPFDYCHVIDTIDTPDDRYTGPVVPAAVASALGFSTSPPASQVFWRCAGQAVFACNSKNTHACDLTPTVDLMLSYCAAHPDAKNLAAPNGTWSCNGKRPSIPRDQEWPVDARGFYPGAWSRVAPPAG